MVDNISKPFTFTANTYAKASEVNADFDTLYTGVNACVNQINANIADIDSMDEDKANVNGNSTQRFAVANPVTDVDAINLRTLKAMYPVGSIYIGIMDTCPMESLFGTWVKIADGKLLQNSDSDHSAGTTISAGLPNITGTVEAGPYWGQTTGCFYGGNSTRVGGGEASGGSSYLARFDASLSSSIYGNSDTVQPPTYVVNIWRRTE